MVSEVQKVSLRRTFNVWNNDFDNYYQYSFGKNIQELNKKGSLTIFAFL